MGVLFYLPQRRKGLWNRSFMKKAQCCSGRLEYILFFPEITWKGSFSHLLFIEGFGLTQSNSVAVYCIYVSLSRPGNTGAQQWRAELKHCEQKCRNYWACEDWGSEFRDDFVIRWCFSFWEDNLEFIHLIVRSGAFWGEEPAGTKKQRSDLIFWIPKWKEMKEKPRKTGYQWPMDSAEDVGLLTEVVGSHWRVWIKGLSWWSYTYRNITGASGWTVDWMRWIWRQGHQSEITRNDSGESS